MSRIRSVSRYLSNHLSSADSWAVLLIAISLIICLGWICYTRYIEEDAFITFRFARQLAAGNGFVYNIGEKIYGTTTPLFTLLLSGWIKFISDNVILGARIFNLFAIFGTLFFTWQNLRLITKSASVQLIPLIALGSCSKLVYMETQGMETPLIICLMAASWYTCSKGNLKWTAFLSGLLLWTRVDLIFWAVTLILVTGIINPRQALRLTILTVITYLPWFVFATLYFGSPIPHTIIAKWVAYSQFNKSPYMAHLLIFLDYLSPFNLPQKVEYLGPLMVWGVIGWALWRGQIFQNKSLHILLTFIFIEMIRITLTRATFFSRYLIPALWAALILFGVGLGLIWDRLQTARTPKFLITACLLLMLILLAGDGMQLAGTTRAKQIFRHDGSLMAMGLWLNNNAVRQSTVLLEPLGYIGYYSDLRMIDVVGLVTPSVVKLKMQNIEFDQYILIFQSDYVVLHCDDAFYLKADEKTGLGRNYALLQTFDPLAFKPGLDQTAELNELARSSCYEIWGKTRW